MTRSDVDRWLRAYVEAWKSYDQEQITELFAEDVRYRYHPHDDPLEGREAVVDAWLGQGSDPGASSRDQPGTYEGNRGRPRRCGRYGHDYLSCFAGRRGEEGFRQLFRDALRSRWPMRGVHGMVYEAPKGLDT